MSQNVWMSSTQHPPRRGRGWLRTLLIGLGLFVVTTIVMLLTGNPNLYPTVILIGNFLVPVVFVAFLYDHQHISSLSLDTVATSFCIGGVLGVLGASILESFLVPTPSNPTHGLSLAGALAVGLMFAASSASWSRPAANSRAKARFSPSSRANCTSSAARRWRSFSTTPTRFATT